MPFLKAYEDPEDGGLILTTLPPIALYIQLNWDHGGNLVQFYSLNDQLSVDILRDVLLLKEAIDAGLSPADLHLRSLNGPPSSQLSAECLAEVAALPFEELVKHLENCRSKIEPRSPHDAFEGPHTEAAELLRAAAFYGHKALMRLLLLLVSPMALIDEMPDVFEEAYEVYGHEGDIGAQLSVGWSALHTAAAGGSLACANVLLLAEPGLATIPTLGGWRPTHVAAWHGRMDVLQLLLADAPATAAAADFEGHLPFHAAALGGWESCVRLLLAVEPAALAALTGLGEAPAHLASMCMRPREPNGSNHAAVVQLLLELHPAAATRIDGRGRLPLTSCAGGEHGSAEVFNMLLQANPAALNARDSAGCLPVHLAAGSGNVAVLRILHGLVPDSFLDIQTIDRCSPMHLAARNGRSDAVSFLLDTAPVSVAIVDSNGMQPLSLALAELAKRHAERPAITARDVAQDRRLLETVRRLLPAVPAATALSSLAGASSFVQQALFSDAVTCHLPLSPAEWLLVPPACPGLPRALPAALRHGQEQARQLVRRLPQADKAWLRTAVLSMARVQRLAHATLPPAVFERLLAQAFAE